MRIVFLQTAQPGLRWMKRYYREHPQLNRDRVFANFAAARDRLRDSPFVGHRFDDFETVRELPIAKSPFSILFTRRNDTIFIIDIRDRRGLRSQEALTLFVKELKERYKLDRD